MYSIALGPRFFKWKMLSLSGPNALLFLQLLIALVTCIVSNIGMWSEFSAWIVFQVVLLYSEDDMVVMSGDVAC